MANHPLIGAPLRGWLHPRRWVEQMVVLLLSAGPALLVGLGSIPRPAVLMGSDQDLLWASEALRLLRGLGPSYADHPGAFWTLLYAFNIKTLSWVSPQPLLDAAGRISPTGLNAVVQVARLESALVAGLTGYLCYWIAIGLGVRKPLALLCTAAIGCSKPVLMAATSVRHELVSMVLLLGATCLLQRLAPCQPQARPRFLLSIGTVLLVYAAAFSKQQALIVWPLGFWMGLQPVLQSHPGAIQGWLTAWKQRRRSTGLLLAGGCGLAWVLCAIPDLDLINLPVWTTINLSFVVILMLGRNHGQRKTDWVPCLLWVIALGLLITKGIAPNWWRQAVTGFPSWMLMFGRQQQSLQEHGADLLQGLQDYAEGLFVLPQLALSSLGVIALVAVILCITEPAKTSEQPINRNQTWLGIGVAWILAIAVLLICSARVNQPYTVYFFPPFMLIATWSVHSAMPWPPSAHSRRWESGCITAGAIVLLATGSLASFENLWHLNRYSQAALPETWICTSQNMDRAMGLTAVGRCKSFQQEADKKSIFDDWHGPH
jgi:hypothetical protein